MRTDEGLLKEEHDFLLGKTVFNMEQEKENQLQHQMLCPQSRSLELIVYFYYYDLSDVSSQDSERKFNSE